ncbi:MAG: hypothetical protein Q8K75_05500 [Chlamydiales bacterium]|nr:hypothetical protein [Chlamydiales bacterium]
MEISLNTSINRIQSHHINVNQGEYSEKSTPTLDLKSDGVLTNALHSTDRMMVTSEKLQDIMRLSNEDQTLPPIPACLQRILIDWLRQPISISWKGTGKFEELSFELETSVHELLGDEEVEAYLYGSGLHKLILTNPAYLDLILTDLGFTEKERKRLLAELKEEPLTSNPHDMDIKRFRDRVTNDHEQRLVDRLVDRLPERFRNIAPDDALVIEFLKKFVRRGDLRSNVGQSWSKLLLRNTIFKKNGPCFNSYMGGFYVVSPKADCTPNAVKKSWGPGMRPPEMLDVESLRCEQLFEHDLMVPLSAMREGRIDPTLRPQGKMAVKGILNLMLRCRQAVDSSVVNEQAWQRLLIAFTNGMRNISQTQINDFNNKIFPQELPKLVYDTIHHNLEGDLSAAAPLIFNACVLLGDRLSPQDRTDLWKNAFLLLQQPPKVFGQPPPKELSFDAVINLQPAEVKAFAKAICLNECSFDHALTLLQATNYVRLNSNAANVKLLSYGDGWCIPMAAGDSKLMVPCKPFHPENSRWPESLIEQYRAETVQCMPYERADNTLHRHLIAYEITPQALVAMADSIPCPELALQFRSLACHMAPTTCCLTVQQLNEAPATTQTIAILEHTLPYTRFASAVNISKKGKATLPHLRQKDIQSNWTSGWIRTLIESPYEQVQLLGVQLWKEHGNRAIDTEVINTLSQKTFWIAVSTFNFLASREMATFEQLQLLCQQIPSHPKAYDRMALQTLRVGASSILQNIAPIGKNERKLLRLPFLRLLATHDPTEAPQALSCLNTLLAKQVLVTCPEVNERWTELVLETAQISWPMTLEALKVGKTTAMPVSKIVDRLGAALANEFVDRPPTPDQRPALYSFLTDYTLNADVRESLTPYLKSFLKKIIKDPDQDTLKVLQSALKKAGPCALCVVVLKAVKRLVKDNKQCDAIKVVKNYLPLVVHADDLAPFQELVREALPVQNYRHAELKATLELLNSDACKKIFKEHSLQRLLCLTPWLEHTSEMDAQVRLKLVETLVSNWVECKDAPTLAIATSIAQALIDLPSWSSALTEQVPAIRLTVGHTLLKSNDIKEALRWAEAIDTTQADSIEDLEKFFGTFASQLPAVQAAKLLQDKSVQLGLGIVEMANVIPNYRWTLAEQLLQHNQPKMALTFINGPVVEGEQALRGDLAKRIFISLLEEGDLTDAEHALVLCCEAPEQMLEWWQQLALKAATKHSYNFAADIILNDCAIFIRDGAPMPLVTQTLCGLVAFAEKAPKIGHLNKCLNLLASFPTLSKANWESVYSNLRCNGSWKEIDKATELLEQANYLNSEDRIGYWLHVVRAIKSTEHPMALELISTPPNKIANGLFPNFETQPAQQCFMYWLLFDSVRELLKEMPNEIAPDTIKDLFGCYEDIATLLRNPALQNYTISMSLSVAAAQNDSSDDMASLVGLSNLVRALDNAAYFLQPNVEDIRNGWRHYWQQSFGNSEAVPPVPNDATLLHQREGVKMFINSKTVRETLFNICQNANSSARGEEMELLKNVWAYSKQFFPSSANIMVMAYYLNKHQDITFHHSDLITTLNTIIGYEESPDSERQQSLAQLGPALLNTLMQQPGADYIQPIKNFLNHPRISSIFNLTTLASAWDHLYARSLFEGMNKPAQERAQRLEEYLGGMQHIFEHLSARNSESISYAIKYILLAHDADAQEMSKVTSDFFSRLPATYYQGLDSIIDPNTGIGVDVSAVMHLARLKLLHPWRNETDAKLHHKICETTLFNVLERINDLAQDPRKAIEPTIKVFLEQFFLGSLNLDSTSTPELLLKAAFKAGLFPADIDKHICYLWAHGKPSPSMPDIHVAKVYSAAIYDLMQGPITTKALGATFGLLQQATTNKINKTDLAPCIDLFLKKLRYHPFAQHNAFPVLVNIHELIHLIPNELKGQYQNDIVQVIREGWSQIEERRDRDNIALDEQTLVMAAYEVLISGRKNGCYNDNMLLAFADLEAFLPIFKTVEHRRKPTEGEVMLLLARLSVAKETYPMRASTMTKWIELIAATNKERALSYFKAAIQNGWYIDQFDLLKQAKQACASGNDGKKD